MNEIITSKYRTNFWIRIVIAFAGVIFLTALCVHYSFVNGKLDYRSGLLWIAVITVIGFVAMLFKFFTIDLSKITVTPQHIIVDASITKKEWIVDYSEIIKFTLTQEREKRGAGLSDGYYVLEIMLTNDRIITISEDEYENYESLKGAIYQYHKQLTEVQRKN